MNICSRCFHKDVCENYEYDLIEAYGNNEEACDFFADCEKIAIMCLNEDDTVYKWCEPLKMILKYKVAGMSIRFFGGKTEKRYNAGALLDGEIADYIEFSDNDIGKTVFWSESSAKQVVFHSRRSKT